MAVDPVCKMNVNPQKAAAKAVYAGQTYYFCCIACHKTFTAQPNKICERRRARTRDRRNTSPRPRLTFPLQWPTLVTHVMFPMPVLMYARPANREEREALAGFGENCAKHAARISAFCRWWSAARDWTN